MITKITNLEQAIAAMELVISNKLGANAQSRVIALVDEFLEHYKH